MTGKIVFLSINQLALVSVGLGFMASHGSEQNKKDVKDLKKLFDKTLFTSIGESKK